MAKCKALTGSAVKGLMDGHVSTMLHFMACSWSHSHTAMDKAPSLCVCMQDIGHIDLSDGLH